MLVETGIGERVDDKTRAMRVYEGPPIVPALEAAGFLPETVDVVAMSHLHFDHAGGLLRADGDAGVPARDDRRPEGRVGDRPRRQPAPRRLVRAAGAARSSATGAREGWADGERELLPGVTVVPTGGHSTGHQAIVVRGTGDGAQTLAFFGDLFMRPWGANPRWVTAFDDFPLDSVARKAELFAQAADEGWIVVLSHESEAPGRPAVARSRPLPVRADLGRPRPRSASIRSGPSRPARRPAR